MKVITKCRMIISLVFAVCASLVTWLVLSEESPLDRYFLYHVNGRNLVGRLVFLPYAVILLLRPNLWADQLSYALIFVQWLVVGLVLSIVICRRRSSR